MAQKLEAKGLEARMPCRLQLATGLPPAAAEPHVQGLPRQRLLPLEFAINLSIILNLADVEV